MPRTVVPVTEVSMPKAAYTTSLTGTNNDLLFTAKVGGPGGNSIQVTYVVAGTNTPLTVVVSGFSIVVNVATGGGGAASSTAADIKAAVDANADAAALVSVANASSNDGTGIVTAMSVQSLAGGLMSTLAPAQVNGDLTNKHYFTGNSADVLLEVVSSDAGTQTVTVQFAPAAAGGIQAVAGYAESVAAGATRILGPFDRARFNQNAAGDVYFDPSVNTTLKFRAYRVGKAARG